MTVADSTASHVTCGTLSASSPRVYSHGDVSFHFKTDGSGDARGFMLTYKLYTYNPVIGKYLQWKTLLERFYFLPLLSKDGQSMKTCCAQFFSLDNNVDDDEDDGEHIMINFI